MNRVMTSRKPTKEQGDCSEHAVEPSFSGEMWAEFVGRKEDVTSSYLYCYFRSSIDGDKPIKVKAFKKKNLKGEILGYFPVKSKIDFMSVPLNTNWRCKFKTGKQHDCQWLTAEQVNFG